MRNGHHISEVIEYLQGNLPRKLTLSDVAGVWEVRSDHFCHAFGAAMEKLLRRSLRDLRTERATFLLEATFTVSGRSSTRPTASNDRSLYSVLKNDKRRYWQTAGTYETT